jgi:hypothetical protein
MNIVEFLLRVNGVPDAFPMLESMINSAKFHYILRSSSCVSIIIVVVYSMQSIIAVAVKIYEKN